MAAQEPITTAVVLGTVGVLLLLTGLSTKVAQRLGLPLALAFLGLGMLAGSEGLGGIAFEDYALTYRMGTAALVLILFEGGLNTGWSGIRRVAAPAAVLATAGVAGTAAAVAGAGHALGMPWAESLLLGAVVSSTDASALFPVLKGGGLRLRGRVSLTLEAESGLNDPVAVLLTGALVTALQHGGHPSLSLLWVLPWEFGLGALSGWVLGRLGRTLLSNVSLQSEGLYSVLSMAIPLLAFGLTTLLKGSGFLAVYVAGLVVAEGPLPVRRHLRTVHGSLSWFAQIGMFLMLGLLVFPSRLLPVAGLGLVLALFLAVVARPLVTLLCLLPFGFSRREVAFMGWTGLRGAVPIILATAPVLAHVQGGERLFNLVFFMVVVNALVPGATIAWAARALGMEDGQAPRSNGQMEG
ncbi:MAG TPA: potassium/proton antiporter [Holophagaceae bacterium]|nr:potassium/proton antiporter [Holophagaceae bacterium]